MSAETDDIELAQWLNGIGSSKQRSETPTNDPGATKTIYGTATSDSDNGTVYVDLEGTTVSGSGEQSVPLTTTCPVKNGQKVIITLVNNDPIVTGVAGWGDEANQKIAAAEAIAKAAIQAVDVEYALGESQTTPPESGWSTTAPEWREGMYMWQRTVTYTSEGTSYSDPTCIQGAQGPQGAQGAQGPQGNTGIGVKAVVEQYYLSTSSTTQSGGSWSTNQPKWSEGKYIWTRSQVTWTNNTVTTTTPVLAQAINGANDTANEAVNKVEKINYYFWTDNSGAHVTTQPNNATTGPNILIDGNGFHIRQGEVETAFFKSDEIGLGSNSQTSVIRMCGGLGEIGTVSSSSSSVLALFGELVGLRGSSGSVVGNNLANLTTTDDDAVLSANGSIVLNSKISYISTENADSRIYLFGTNGYLKPYISSGALGYNGPVLSGKTYAGIEAGTANSGDLNTGVYCISTPDGNSNGIVFNALQFLPGTNGSFLPIETLYNHAVMAMPDEITTTQTNVFQVGKFHSIAQTGNYVSVNSSGAIKISHTGTYLISLYGVWYNNSSGDYMHFAIGPSNSDVRFALQRVVHGIWDSGSKTGLLRFTKGTVLYPMVKCEQGFPNTLSGGNNPGNAGQSSCFIQYVGE